MEKLLEKISSFHLIVHLIPGAAFCYLADMFTTLTFPNGSNISDFVVFYFVGVIIGRFGSIVIEPIYKFCRILKFAPYSDYLKAERVDPKIEVLSEMNDFYRSLVSMIVLLTLLLLYEKFALEFMILSKIRIPLFCIFLIILLSFSYRKQTEYVRKRAEFACNEGES